MREPVIFHITPKKHVIKATTEDGKKIEIVKKDKFLPHTYSIKKSESNPDMLCVGYSVAHDHDHFNKAIGRNLAIIRMEAADKAVPVIPGGRIHDLVMTSLEAVIDRAATLLKIPQPATIITRTDFNGRKHFSYLQVTKEEV